MTYLEIFGGGGSVLFNKERSAKEILNDYNSDLINLYRCVREHPNELIDKLFFVLNSREDFKQVCSRLNSHAYEDSVQRAADFYQVIRQSYGGKGVSFGASPRGMWSNFPILMEACSRLQGVILENGDFEKVFRIYDSPDTFSYLDPPYYFTEDYYPGKCFLRSDHERLANLLFQAAGLWFLSYNDCPEILELYQKPGVYIERIRRINNMAQRYHPGSEFAELFITNYDTSITQPEQLSLEQLSLSSFSNTQQRREYIWT